MMRLTRKEIQARTRRELITAAGRVFARRGYDAASIAEIADDAGYSHGAVYSNFASKEELFLALYEEWVAERVAEIDASFRGGLLARGGEGAEEWLRRVGRNPDPFLLRLEFTVRAARDPRLRRRLGLRVSGVPLALSRMLEEAATAEGVEFALPADEVALALQALCLGLALEAVANPRAVRPGLARELVGRMLEGLAREHTEARQ